MRLCKSHCTTHGNSLLAAVRTSETTVARLLVVLADVRLVVPTHRTPEEHGSPEWTFPAWGEGGGVGWRIM